MIKRVFSGLVLLLFLFTIPQAAEEEQKKLTFSGTIGSDVGQFIRARYQYETFDHVWYGNSMGVLNMQTFAGKRLSLRLGILGRMWYNSFPPSTIKETNAGYDKYFSFELLEAQGILSIIKNEALLLEMGGGVFPYKYNAQATDLGEYLFRSGTYPAYIINRFDFTKATLSGLRISAKGTVGWFGYSFDQLFTLESEIRPFHDLTIASILSVNALKLVEIGGGVSFARAIPVDKDITMPKHPDASFVNSPGDTGYYTFSGTKLMARATVDPLFFLRETGAAKFLGQGGKIYGEMAILGVKDYPKTTGNSFGYDTLIQKSPRMFGITIPVPFALDVCAFEMEYYACPFQNDYGLVFQKGWPLPQPRLPDQGEYTANTYRNDNWKWSIYIKKQVTPHFAITGQAGRDHQRWEAHISHLRNYDFEDATVKYNQWLWHLKMEFCY